MSTANQLNKADDGGDEASMDENFHDTDMHLDEKAATLDYRLWLPN